MENIQKTIENLQNSTQETIDPLTPISRGDFEKLYNIYLKEISTLIGISDDLLGSDYLKLILLWASGSHAQCKAKGIDKKRGLLLMGTVGCGKTTAMAALRKLNLFQYRSLSCLEAAQRVGLHGSDYIDRLVEYNYQDVCWGNRLNHYYFDDLGIEGEVCHYGNWIDVMPTVLTLRYNEWQRRKLITHASTNLTVNQLEERYGDRLFSRFKEMFNLIVFEDGTDLRSTIKITST